MDGGAVRCAPLMPLRAIFEMGRLFPTPLRKFLNASLAITVSLTLLPTRVCAWGGNGHKVVVNQAINTLPPELRSSFETSRFFLVQHVTDPLDAEAKTPALRNNHFIRLDKYGRFPFDALPRSYKAAVNKYGKSRIQSTGLLPWEIGVYSQKLTEAIKLSRCDDAKLDAAILAFYVAEAHDPFNTTDNFYGHLTNQTRLNEPFCTTPIDAFPSLFS